AGRSAFQTVILRAVLLPESFRGGCSFGVRPLGPNLSRATSNVWPSLGAGRRRNTSGAGLFRPRHGVKLRPLDSPRVQDRLHRTDEVLRIARNDGETVNKRRRRNQRVRRFEGPTCQAALRSQPARKIGDFGIDVEYAACKPGWHRIFKPLIEKALAPSLCHALNAVPHFENGDDTDEKMILIGVCQPVFDRHVGLRLNNLGNHIGIEKKHHNLGSRSRLFSRSNFTPDPRSGDAAKNSARVPTRLVLRPLSPADTTIAFLRPLRVIVCGPSEPARSRTSLNFAFASATVQMSSVIGNPPLWSS